MDPLANQIHGRAITLPEIRTITLDHPWRWLAAAWGDMREVPLISVVHGGLFFLLLLLMVYVPYINGLFFYVPALIAGLFLLSPVMAFGLYDISRCLAMGERPRLFQSLMLWRNNPYNLLALGLILLLAFMVWMMVANVVFALFYSAITPDFENFFQQVFLSGESPGFLFVGLLSGSVIAFAVFAISVIAVPLMVDSQVDFFSATLTSVRAVMKNPRPLLLWAAQIIGLVVLGMLFFGLGLVLTMPLVGYASWHAYQDLVDLEGG